MFREEFIPAAKVYMAGIFLLHGYYQVAPLPLIVNGDVGGGVIAPGNSFFDYFMQITLYLVGWLFLLVIIIKSTWF